MFRRLMLRSSVPLLIMSFMIIQTLSVSARIEYCRVSPSGTVTQGTILDIHIKGDEGTTRFRIDNGGPFGEFAGPENHVTYDTRELSVGQHTLRCYLRKDGGWRNAEVEEVSITIVGTAGSLPTSGGVNIDGYCEYLGYDNWSVDQRNAYTLKCYEGNRETGLDMYRLCAWQYGGRLPYPGLANAGDASSWSCNAHPAHIDQTVPEVEPEPTARPSRPTQLPVVGYASAPAGDWVKVVTPRLNVRRGSSVNTPAIAQSVEGSYFRYLGRDASTGWYNVDWGTGTGWVANGTQYTRRGSGRGGSSTTNGGDDPVTACSFPEPVSAGRLARVITWPSTVRLNVRSGASMRHRILTKLEPGTIISITGNSRCVGDFRWWPISVDGIKGWVVDGDDIEYWLEDAGPGR